jgi:tRNA(Ser,Leu) C12 N-acetylase TAN1
MHDWNVVISLHERQYGRARKRLEKLGQVRRTAYFNVLVMKVEDIGELLETLQQEVKENPRLLTILARVMPVTQVFTFQTVEEFEAKAREASLTFVSDLVGKTFHIRMHRRGFKGRLSSQDEEKFLDEVLLEALAKREKPGQITFADPDAILAVETVDCQAGLSLWTREDRQRYAFLRLD